MRPLLQLITGGASLIIYGRNLREPPKYLNFGVLNKANHYATDISPPDQTVQSKL